MISLRSFAVLCLGLVAALAGAQTNESPIRQELRALANGPVIKDWQKHVGATAKPAGERKFLVQAKGDGQTLCTKAIQSAIDDCAAAGGGTVEFAPGEYVTGSLFLQSNVDFHVGKGVTLLGAEEDDAWPMIHTRVAGIEMDWRAALLNVRGQQKVGITGAGTINGRGKRWWDKFRVALPEYAEKGLRWAVDYDVSRPHLIQIYESRDVTLQGLTLDDSPFWTVHVVFSKNVTVDGLTIRDNLAGRGPSTDGVNIDSSAFCLVQNCDVDNNDDCYSFKAGMNADGLRVNLPVQYTIFRDCIARRGGGVITLGSDMSGGIRHVEAYRLQGLGTTEGIRFKSTRIRGGLVDDVYLHDIRLENVPKAINADLNWYPQFSFPKLPTNQAVIPPAWQVIAAPVPPDKALPHFRNITITDVQATGADTGITVRGIPEAPMENVTLKRLRIQAASAGKIEYAKNWTCDQVKITGADGQPVVIKDCENVSLK